MIRSTEARPTIRWKPSSPITATSPVRNQPSAVQDSASASGRFRYPANSVGPATWSSPTLSPSCGVGEPSSPTSLVRTPSSGRPTLPGRRSPSARVLTVISDSVMPYRSIGACPVSSASCRKTGTGSGALPETSSRAPRSAAAAEWSAAIRDQTVGTPKYSVPPACA